MFKAVIFDFDGVVLDSEPIHYEACCSVLKDININLSYEEYNEKYLGRPDKDIFPLILQNIFPSISSAEMHLLIQKKINSYINILNNQKNLPVISGIDEYITHLARQKIQMAICSGSTKKEILCVLNNWNNDNFKDYFSIIISSEDVIHGKPSPEGYLLAAKNLNLNPSECLVIEDSCHGIMAAKNAGMKVIALSTKVSKSLNPADWIFQDFNQIMQQLENISTNE